MIESSSQFLHLAMPPAENVFQGYFLSVLDNLMCFWSKCLFFILFKFTYSKKKINRIIDLLNNTWWLREKKIKRQRDITNCHSLFFFPSLHISLENKHQYLITVSRFFFFFSSLSIFLFFSYDINQFGFSLLETSSKRSASKAFSSSSMKKQRCKFISPPDEY